MSQSQISQPSPLPLYLLPAAQAALFVAAVNVFPDTPLLALVLLLLAALALCLSLHMSYHEAAHRSSNWPQWRRFFTGLLLTPLLGMSFHGYRLSHWNHHRYNNGLRDFTSTWTRRDGVPRPKNLVWYCLSWPRVFFETPNQFKTALAEGDADIRILIWSTAETLLQLTLLVLIGSYSMAALLLYVNLIYVGWALISLHNYGQHPPDEYDNWYRTASYRADWYNRLLFNNGLHYEHHVAPSVPIARLSADSEAKVISVPHLLAPLVARSGGRSTRQ